ncbi:EMC3/TMCO1 family protein [Halobellus sp. GM3]|uniref:EMC3/TMCO1 family protein n=1 Tax=Halobellus sp. GM3 TaxID=3458410 RepID=UPI00403D6DF8
MPRIESKVRTLVSEDGEMREAVETVLEQAEDGEREVQWLDVKGELTSGQWGRLIEKGVLVEGEAGFRLADAEATRTGLEPASNSTSGASAGSSVEIPDDDESSWSAYDKGAAVVTVGLFVGYSWKPLRDAIGTVMDVPLSPLQELLPFYAVVMILALATGLYSTLLQANLMDMDKMSAYQDRMKDIQERRKEAKEAGDDAALDAIQEEQMEAMGDQLGMFKEQFRPMVWIMFFTIPVFLWMYWTIGVGQNATAHAVLDPLVLPLAGQVQWTDSVIGPIQAWIVWYFLCSMGFTQIIRKSLNIDISPTSA